MKQGEIIDEQAINALYKDYEDTRRFLPLGLKWFWSAPKWLQRFFTSKVVPEWVIQESFKMRSQKLSDGSLGGKVISFGFGHPTTLEPNEGDFICFISKKSSECIALLIDKKYLQPQRAWIIAVWDKQSGLAINST